MSDLRSRILHMSVFRLCLIITAVFSLFYVLQEERGVRWEFLDLLELRALDLKFLSRGTLYESGDVVVAAIDEKSLKQYGRFPWDRNTIAELVNRLKLSGAAVIGFDVIFSEEVYHNCPESLSKVDEALPECADDSVRDVIRTELERYRGDENLADAVESAGNVVLGFFIFTDPVEYASIPDKQALEERLELLKTAKVGLFNSLIDNPERYPVPWPKGLGAQTPLEVLSESTDHFGHFSFTPDPDGTLRWADLVVDIRDDDGTPRIYPSLALESIRVFLEQEIIVNTYAKGVESIAFGRGDEAVAVPTDQHGRMLINFYGPSSVFTAYSASDIIEGRVPDFKLKDKIVLFGPTATGLFDLRVTTFQKNIPGVFIHANIIDNILTRRFIVRPYWAFFFELGTLLLIGLVFGLVLQRVSSIWGAAVVLLAMVVFMAADRLLIFGNNLWVFTVLPVAEALSLFVAAYLYRYVTEEREKRKVRDAFKYYLNESVIAELLKDVSKLKLGGEKKELTVLFSDIRAFTTLSEALPPEKLALLLNRYLTPMTAIVLRYEGLLDKYVGDELMAVFGAPQEQPDHAVRACAVALEMGVELARLNKVFAAEGLPEIRIGIGVNSGPMVVGNMGSEMRFDYTVIGDHVNLGARLEGLNKTYGVPVIVSEYTWEKVRHAFIGRRLDLVRVKGKGRPVTIYELVRSGTERGPEERHLDLYDEALELYLKRDWEGAAGRFAEVERLRPGDVPAALFRARIELMRADPPGADWDGVWTMQTK